MHSVLPQKLVDEVIDRIRFDHKLLLVCSTVSHSWRESALRWLFRSPLVWSNQINHFSLLLSTAPHIARYIVKFTLRSTEERVKTSLIITLLTKLVNLRELSLFGLELRGTHNCSLQFRLEKLLVCMENPSSIEILLSMLGRFPHIQGLVFFGSGNQAAANSTVAPKNTLKDIITLKGITSIKNIFVDPTFVPNANIHRLVLSSPTAALIAMVRRHIARCRTLEVRTVPDNCFVELGLLIKAISPTLAHFRFLWPIPPLDQQTDYTTLNLQRCTSLRSALIHITSNPWSRPWDAAVKILQNLPPTCSRISILLSSPPTDADEERELARMRPLFDRFTSLERVTFGCDQNISSTNRFQIPDVDSTSEDFVKRIFTQLDKRGVLEWRTKLTEADVAY